MEKYKVLENYNCGWQPSAVLINKGIEACPTDFAILTGTPTSDVLKRCTLLQCCETKTEKDRLELRTGEYWTSTTKEDEPTNNNILPNSAFYVTPRGLLDSKCSKTRSMGLRVAITDIDAILENNEVTRAEDGILELYYGWYPSQAASSVLQKRLDYVYANGSLEKSGNTYSIDSRKVNIWEDYEKEFEEVVLDEYSLLSERYVRVPANLSEEHTKLSNGDVYNSGDNVWVKVEPVRWFVDEKQNILLSEKILMGGIRQVDIDTYLNNVFNKNLEQTLPKIKVLQK